MRFSDPNAKLPRVLALAERSTNTIRPAMETIMMPSEIQIVLSGITSPESCFRIPVSTVRMAMIGIISKNELTRYARKERIRRFFCKPENNKSL